jgi:hypothetical protein
MFYVFGVIMCFKQRKESDKRLSKLIWCQRIVMISRFFIDIRSETTIVVIVVLCRKLNAIVIAVTCSCCGCVCRHIGVVVVIHASSAHHKKCDHDQPTDEKQCDSAANNAANQSSVVVRCLSCAQRSPYNRY